MLMKRIGYDFPARLDAHCSVLPSTALRALFAQRFHVDTIVSAAGLTGWLTGYPEKYHVAFVNAGMPAFAWLTALFSLIKRTPAAGVLLRLLNSTINHFELALGLQGGGSCCARLRKPAHSGAFLQDRGAAP